MKKTILIIVFLSLTLLSQAQDNKWEIGIEAGPNISAISGLPLPYTSTISYSSGFTARYHVTEKFSIKSGIGFEIKGDDYKFSSTDSAGNTASFNNKYLYDYLILPILARYDFGDVDKLHFFAEGGPYFGYLLTNVTELSSKDFNGTSQSSVTSGIQATNRFDMGLSLGFGLSKKISDKLIAEIELRGNAGVINISSAPLYVNQFSGLLTESANLLIGVRYRL